MSDGCTIGAKRIGARVLTFKNRDLVYADFKSVVSFDAQVFAVTGVDIATGVPSGVSIGVNRHGLSACSATVLIGTGSPYDPLLDEILRQCKDVRSAHRIVTGRLQAGERYQWCNIVVASTDEVGAIEIGDGVCDLETDKTQIVRTNHHLRLPTTDTVRKAGPEQREAAGPLYTSQHRRQVASDILKTVTTLTDVTSLVSQHSEDRGFSSICRHKDGDSQGIPLMGETSYSYVIEVSAPKRRAIQVSIHAVRGNPCSHPFRTLALDFDASPSEKARIVSAFP